MPLRFAAPQPGSLLRALFVPRGHYLTLGILLLLALTACSGGDEDDLIEVERPGDLAQVVDRQDAPLSQAAVVRVTEGWIVALAAIPTPPAGTPPKPPQEVFLRLGDERIPAVVRPCGGGLVVVRARRGDRALRPFGLTTEITPALEVRARSPGGTELSTSLTPAPQGGLTLEDSAPANEWAGGVVLRGSRLVGFLTPAEGAEAEGTRVVTISGSLARSLPVICATPGADLLAPGDGFSALELAVRTPASLPPVVDDWGDADFFLTLEEAEEGTPVASLPLVPGQHLPPRLIILPDLGPLNARLVERDVSLNEGSVDQPLAQARVVDPRSGAARLRFDLPGDEQVALGLRLRVVDPDRASGFDRTILGAKALRLADAKHGVLSLSGGDATDHWRFDAIPRSRSLAPPKEAPKELLLIAFRADPAHVALEGWTPGADAPVWRLKSAPGGSRLVALRLEAGAPRHWIRARHERIRAPSDPRLGIPTTYAFAIAPPDQPNVQAGLLLELLVGEAQRKGAPYLSARSLARETLRALSEVGGADRQALTAAFLPGLGHPEPAARLLVLELLSAHLPPNMVAVERLRRGARGLARETDAGLLLVARCRDPRRLAEVEVEIRLEDLRERDGASDIDRDPDLTPAERRTREIARVWRSLPSSERDALLRAAGDAIEDFLLRGAKDPLPEIRLRAIALAAGVPDRALRVRLRERLETLLDRDPSPRVRRALLTAFWSHE